MASQELRSVVNEYEQFYKKYGLTDEFLKAYLKATETAIVKEKDIEYGLRLSERAKGLIENSVNRSTDGGDIWWLEKQLFLTGESYYLLDLYYDFLKLESYYRFESFIYCMERKRPFKKRFYQPRRKTLKIVVDDLQKLEDSRKQKFFGLSMPSRVGKSTVCIFFLAWIAMKRPNSHSAMGGHSGILAKGFYKELLNLMITEEYTFKELYDFWHPEYENKQYVLRGTDDKKSDEISWLNAIMDSENKQECDIDICRWRSICGTAYRFIGNDDGNGSVLDESDFELSSENPMHTFVVYFPNNKPAFSCQIREDENGQDFYFCYTNGQWFEISEGKLRKFGINGNGAIPVIEYPNNSRRLSDIEMTIAITDAINTLSSDRINGIEQFVSSWVKFVNCEVDKDSFLSMREEGALVVKSNNGAENKADVDVMTTELNQTEGQVVFNDLFERFLDIQGLANRGNINTGGDTQGAVNLRNGHYDAGLRTAINEPILKKSENMTIKIILNRLRISKGFTLVPSDVEIHINHNKLDNMMVKAEVLQILLNCGIHYKRAIKVIDMFSDPEQVAIESKNRMESLYPDKIEKQEKIEEPVNKEVVEQ